MRARLIFLSTLFPLLAFSIPTWGAHGTLDLGGISCSGAPSDCGDGPIKRADCRDLLIESLHRGITPVRSDAMHTSNSAFPSPVWLTSGAWLTDESLLLVDALRDDLLLYSVNGRLIEHAGSHLHGSRIEATDDGSAWIQMRDGVLAKLNQELRIERQVNPAAIGDAASPRLASLYSWTMGSGAFVGFGDYRRLDGAWETGLVVADGTGNRSTLLDRMDIDDPFRPYYLLGFPFLASAGGKSYFLRMAAQPTLYEITPGGEQMRRILTLKETRFAPVPPRRGAAGAQRIYAAIERSAMPVGIYGQGDHLYLLYRRPAGAELTEWRLTTIDTNTNSVLRTIRLPTSAHHICIIPGRKAWALVEKGAVRALGDQEVGPIVLFNISALEVQQPASAKRVRVRLTSPLAR
jgi:hypothetical protein